MQKMRVCVLLRCCFCCDLVPAARAVKEPARRRRRSSCYVLVSTLSAPFASFVAVPVAADAPAGAPAHCLHWWCCCGLCYAQLLYLLLLQLKLLDMQQRFLQGGCLSSSLACLLCRSCSASLACCCCCCCCCCSFISLKIRSDNKEQAGAPRAEKMKAPSAERGARCDEKMKAPPASASQSARSAVQRHRGPDEANLFDKIERIRAFAPRT